MFKDLISSDVIARACRHPIAYSGIYRVTDLRLVEKKQEGDHIYSFTLAADNLPTWHAGQHSIFTLPGKPVEGKTWRPFSVAASPKEGVVKIGTIISDEPSSFKYHLSSLQPGETVRMHGPYGEFFIKPKMKKIVGVAGGIGITPFRSILMDLAEDNDSPEVNLIFSAANNNYAFKAELEECRQKNPKLGIKYTATPEEVNAELNKLIDENGNNAYYFLSGPPKMIEALRKTLHDRHIPWNHVINDPFKGY